MNKEYILQEISSLRNEIEKNGKMVTRIEYGDFTIVR